jgi:hypothetical protein
MKKYNKYGAAEKNQKLNLYDVEIVKEYNGSKVDEKALVAKIIGKEETFHIFILPNYEENGYVLDVIQTLILPSK